MKRVAITIICILLLMQATAGAVTSEAERIKSMIDDAARLSDSEPDSALAMLRDAYLLSIEHNLDSLQMLANLRFSRHYERSANYYLAIDYAFNALEILEKTSIDEMTPRELFFLMALYSRLGFSYYSLDSRALARKYYSKVAELVDEISSRRPGVFSDHLIASVLINIGAISLEIDSSDEVFGYLSKAGDMLDNLKDSLLLSSLLINKGIYYRKNNLVDSAMMAYNEAIGIAKKIDNSHMLARAYNNKANLEEQSGNTEAAIMLYTKALNIAREISSWKSVEIAAKALRDIYAERGDYKKSHEKSEIVNMLNDSIFLPERNQQYERIALQYDFDTALRIQQSEHTAKWRAQRDQKLLFIFLTIILTLVVVIIVVLMLALRRRARYERLQKDFVALKAQKLADEKKEIQAELEMKNHHLMEKAMWLSQKNDFIMEITRQLADVSERLTDGDDNQIQQVISQLKNDTDGGFRKEFEMRFNDAHKDFIQALNEKFPDLSPAERKLIAYLRLNLSTKEIAALTYQNPDSIKVARSRLRSKLGLEKNENLVAFLQSF